MVSVEKLDKGTYYEDAFKVSFKYDPTTVAKIKELAERRYLPDDRAWEIPAHEIPNLVEKLGIHNITSNSGVMDALKTKEIEDKREATQERLRDIKPIIDFPFTTTPLPHQIEAFNYGLERDELLIGDEQGLKEYNPVYIVGKVSPEDRQKEVERFQNDPNCKLAVGTIGAMGTGLTLNKASYVFFIDKLWNSGENAQAEDRAHRIGTAGTVNVISMVAKGSVDEGVEEYLLENQDLFDRVVDGKGSKADIKTILNKLLKL